MAEWLKYLGDLQIAPPAEQDAWLAAHPLRALLQDIAVGEIRRSALNRHGPPDDGAPYRMVLRLMAGPAYFDIRLPAGLSFTGLRFTETPDRQLRYSITFETDRGTIRTNAQELFKTLSTPGAAAATDEDDYLRLFFGFERCL